MIPSEAMSDGRARVLLAVTWLRHPTVRRVAEDADRSLAVTYRHLQALRADGLVAWEDGLAGTLHALVEEVPL